MFLHLSSCSQWGSLRIPEETLSKPCNKPCKKHLVKEPCNPIRLRAKTLYSWIPGAEPGAIVKQRASRRSVRAIEEILKETM